MSAGPPSSPVPGGGGGRQADGGGGSTLDAATTSTVGVTPSIPFGGPSPPQAGEGGGGVSRLGWAAYALAAVAVALDQLSKWWVLGPLDLPSRGQLAVLPPWLNFTLTHNPGVSFRLLAGGALSRWGLTAFSVVVAGALGVWAARTRSRVQALGIGLIMGGALGNALDRARLGMVTDFVDVSAALPFFPWIFNVADSAISVGVAVLLLESVLAPSPPKPSEVAPEKPA